MSKRKSIIGFIGFVVLFAGIIAGTYLVQQNQDFREKAAPATVVYVSPANQTKDVGSTFYLAVNMDTASNQVTGIDIRLKFNPSLIEITSIQKGSGATVLTTEINNTVDNVNGKISYAVFTVDKTKAISGSGIELLQVNGKIKQGATGTATVSFDAGTVISSVNEGQNVIINSTSGNIIVASVLGALPSATATSTAMATATATATSNATSTSTSTAKSSALVATATSTSVSKATSQATQMPIPVTGSSVGSIALWGVGLFFILASYLLLGY